MATTKTGTSTGTDSVQKHQNDRLSQWAANMKSIENANKMGNLAKLYIINQTSPETMAGFQLGRLLSDGFKSWKANYDKRNDEKVNQMNKHEGTYYDAVQAGYTGDLSGAQDWLDKHPKETKTTVAASPDGSTVAANQTGTDGNGNSWTKNFMERMSNGSYNQDAWPSTQSFTDAVNNAVTYQPGIDQATLNKLLPTTFDY